MAREQALLVEWIVEEKVGRKKEGGRGGREEASLGALFVPVDTGEREREKERKKEREREERGTRVVASKVKKQKQKKSEREDLSIYLI